MILHSGKGCNDPKDLEGVLSVLDRRLYDGGDCGVVLHAGLRPEAAADLEFGLGWPQGLLAVVVRGRNRRIRQEGEDIVLVFHDALLEFVKFSVGTISVRVDGRSGEQFVKPFLHLCPHFLPDVTLIPAMDGVSQEIHHVEAPCVIRKGLHRVCEISQQMGDAYLMAFHSDIGHEVGRPSVGHPYLAAELLLGEVVIDDIVPPAPVESEMGRHGILECPEPVVLAAYVDSGLVGSGDLSVCDFPADHLVRGLGKFPHGVQHVGYGALADMKPEYGLKQMRESLERDILIGAQIGHERGDVRPEGGGCIDRLGELPLAAVAAGALDLHLKMIDHLGGDRKRNVDNLSRRAYRGGVHVQRSAADRADGRREPALRICGVLGLKPRASGMPVLSAGLLSGRLAQGLRVGNADGILGGRHAAVGARLDDRLLAGLKLRDSGLQPVNLFILTDKAAIQNVIGKSLFVKLFGNLRRIEFLGVPHLLEKMLASPCKFYPIRFEALPERCIEVLFHTSKLRKRTDICKYNKLHVNELKTICGLLDKFYCRPFGGPKARPPRIHKKLADGCRGRIFSGPEIRIAA